MAVKKIYELLLGVFTISSFCFAQHESGESYLQVRIANAEAFRNYDVSYKHWVGFTPTEETYKANSDVAKSYQGTEQVTRGRLVVDRDSGKVLQVVEVTSDAPAYRSKEFKCVFCSDGKETVLTRDHPFPFTRSNSLERFHGNHQVPLVELCLSSFPDLLHAPKLLEHFQRLNEVARKSKLLNHQDGSKSAEYGIPGFRTYVTFDPVSSMPTHCTSKEFEPESSRYLRTIQSGSPRFEKCKEIYRILSLEYRKHTSVANSIPIEVVGTCQFEWHQFNEENIRFPFNETFSFENAMEFWSSARSGKEK